MLQDPEGFERQYLALTVPEVVATTTSGLAAARGDENRDEFTTIGPMQITPDTVFKHLQGVQEARGKKVRFFLGLGVAPFLA